MERIPILKMGDCLLVSIQVDMHDRLAMTLQDDLTANIAQHRARGVLIDISALDIREQVAAALHLVVQLVRYSDGKRRVSNVSEITGLESGIITMQELYRFEQTGVGKDGAIEGACVPTGITPTFAEKFKKAGVNVEMGLAGMRWR